MRTALWPLCTLTAAALAAPAVASADILSEYQRLSDRRLSPAPLVPTVAPRALAPLQRTVGLSGARSRKGYALRLVHATPAGADAVIALERGPWKTLRAARRALTHGGGYRSSRTRVRGHAGYLATRRINQRLERDLLWAEGGQVYSLDSGTPRKVSLQDLRTTAAGLDPLGPTWAGGESATDNGAVAVTTAHTITINVDWEAACGAADEVRGGAAYAPLVRLAGNAFSLDIAQHRTSADAWGGSVSGTVSADGIAVSVHASGSVDGLACDSGPHAYTLTRIPIR